LQPARALTRAASVPAWPPPTTITSNISGKFMLQLFCKGRASYNSASVIPNTLGTKLFHVKQLFADAEPAENLAEQVVRGEFSGNLVQRALRQV